MSKDENGVRWSYSRTTCFNNCKYEFYLGYIVNDDEQYLSEGNFYADVGIFVHEILAMIFSNKLKVEDALNYYIDHFDNYVCYKTKKSTMDKTFETIADFFASLDIDWINNYEILGVELKTEFKIEEYDFIGFIDLLLRDKRDGKIIILDHKSSEYPFKANGDVKKNSMHSFEQYKKQMYLYCLGVYQMYGEYPKEIVWHHFKNGGKFARIPFKKEEYNETIKWFKDTLQTIEQEKEFEPSEDYFYCHNLCNFRNSCEYNMVSD